MPKIRVIHFPLADSDVIVRDLQVVLDTADPFPTSGEQPSNNMTKILSFQPAGKLLLRLR